MVIGEEAVKWATLLVSALNKLLRLHPQNEHQMSEYDVLAIIIPTLLGAPDPNEGRDDKFLMPDLRQVAITPASQWWFSLPLADPIRYSYRAFLDAFIGRWVPPYTKQLLRTRFFNGTVNIHDFRAYWSWFDTNLLTLEYLGEVLSDNDKFTFAVNHFRNHRELWSRFYADLGGRDINALRYVMQSQQQARDMLSRQGMGYDHSGNNRDNRGGRGGNGRSGYYAFDTDSSNNLEDYHNHIWDDDSGVFAFPAPEPNLYEDTHYCNLCEIQHNPDDGQCACLDAHFNNLEDEHLDATEYAETVDAVYSAFTKKGPAKGALTDAQRANLVIDSTCRHCGQKGHFVRDCKKLGGSGHSVLGARYGTAEGFKEGDDPSKQPKAYKEARAKRLRKVAAIRSTVVAASDRRQSPRNRPPSKRQGGKFATHARRLRTGHATNPPTPRYYNAHLHGHYALLMEANGDPEAEVPSYSALMAFPTVDEDGAQMDP